MVLRFGAVWETDRKKWSKEFDYETQSSWNWIVWKYKIYRYMNVISKSSVHKWVVSSILA